MKIQFISINDVWRYGNIGMDQLAGYLRTFKFDVRINYFGKRDTPARIAEKIDLTCDIFGFSVTTSNYRKCAEITTIIKSNSPDAVIIFGGGLVSRYYREILQENPMLDYVILGDGELPTKELLNAISNGTEKTFRHASVASQSDIRDKKIQINDFVIPDPAYDYYQKDPLKFNSRKVHCIQTKNNICTGNCSFCTERHGHIFYRNIDEIVRQIEKVHREFGVLKFFFTDDNILDPNDTAAKLRLLELCKRISNLNLRLAFQCYVKATSLKDTPLDRQVLEAMRDAGFVEAFVGLESGNQRDLILYNKMTTVADNYRIISLLREYDIFPILGFISFNPYSTLASIAENFNFLCSIRCTYLFNYIYSFVIINKYTALYDRIVQDGLLLSPQDQYLAVDYAFQDPQCRDILHYVRDVMVPRLNQFDYQLDWVTYSYLEHRIWYDNTPDYHDTLIRYKQEDLEVIKKYLSVLFVEHDLDGFIRIAPDFWKHFQDREESLAYMYQSLVAMH